MADTRPPEMADTRSPAQEFSDYLTRTNDKHEEFERVMARLRVMLGPGFLPSYLTYVKTVLRVFMVEAREKLEIYRAAVGRTNDYESAVDEVNRSVYTKASEAAIYCAYGGARSRENVHREITAYVYAP